MGDKRKISDFSAGDIIEAYSNSSSYRDTLRRLGVTESGTQIKNLRVLLTNHGVHEIKNPSNKLESYTHEIEEELHHAMSLNDLAKRIGYLKNDRRYLSSRQRTRLLKFLEDKNFSYQHVLENDIDRSLSSTRYNDSDVFCEDSVVSQTTLKSRYLSERERDGSIHCDLDCGVGGYWNNMKISLQLDHVNGINTDNRKENLRLLCPNCHSQTVTFGGKKR